MEDDIHVDCTFGHRGVALGEMRRPFHRGKVYVIAGPNGAGKSTLLQTIAGELEPVTGTVRIGDTDPASRAGVGSVARVADPVFLPDLTVGEHLKLLASHGRFDYEDVVQHWGLEALVTSMPAWISSGQRQRVFLAAHLNGTERVLVMDEPERHLDTEWCAFLCGELRALADRGAVVLVATHSDEVRAAGDEVVTLS